MNFTLNFQNRQRTVAKIATFLHHLQPNETRSSLLQLAQKFEDACYTKASNTKDYQSRIEKKLRAAKKAQQAEAQQGFHTSQSNAAGLPFQNSNAGYNNANIRQSNPSSIPSRPFNSFSQQNKLTTNSSNQHYSNNISSQPTDVRSSRQLASATSYPQSNDFQSSNSFGQPSRLPRPNANQQNRPIQNRNFNTSQPEPFSDGNLQVPEPIPFNASNIPDPIPISAAGAKPEICNYGGRKQIFPPQTSLQNETNTDEGGYYRQQKVLEMKRNHGVVLENFRRKSTEFLSTMKAKISQNGMARQLEKLKQYIIYASNTLNYMERCEKGHYPSEQTLAGLSVTIQKILSANKMIEGAISRSKNTQQHPQQTSQPLNNWQPQMQPQKSTLHPPFKPLGSQCSNMASQANGHYRRQQSGNLQSQTEISQRGSEVGYGFGQQPLSDMSYQQSQHAVGVGVMDGQVNSEGHLQNQWPNSQTLPQPNNTQTPIINVTVNVSNIGTGNSNSNDSSKQTPPASKYFLSITQTPIINVTVNVSNIGTGNSNSNDSSKQTPPASKYFLSITQTPIINVTVNVSNIGTGNSNSNDSSKQTPQQVNISYQSNPSVGNQHGFGNQQAADSAKFDPNVQNLSPLKQANTDFDPSNFLQFPEEPVIQESFPKLQSQSSLDLDKPFVQPHVADSVEKETIDSQPLAERSLDNSFEPLAKGPELPEPPTFESSQVKHENDQSFVVKQEPVLSNGQQIQNPLSTQKVNQISSGSVPPQLLTQALERPSAVKTEPPTANQTFGKGITQSDLQRTTKEVKPSPQKFFHLRSDARFSHTKVQPPLKKYKISFSDPHCQPLVHSVDYDGSKYSHDLMKLSCLLNQKLSPVIFRSNLGSDSLVFDCQNIFTVHIIFERLHEDELSSSPKHGKPLTVSVERRCQPKRSTLKAEEDSLVTKMMGQPSDLNFSNQGFFRKVTAHSLQMLMHFLSQHANALGIVLFCEWIQTYSCQKSSGMDTRMMHSLEFDPDFQALLPLHLRSHDGKLLSPEEAC
eukprot:CAMPEP_0117852436 /NCGR_PEP_ID=MMETSP0949-20121206/23068_1 /TAXON_ID=44440 /ORGANISM="Chattonella subsalsa, Strain CCMP2191" /LENGTH=1027 /DNA_ID=CAMNT_0005700593 /DNA_START=630 /DNA_END=3711 /DNA_ORIENTATION=-